MDEDHSKELSTLATQGLCKMKLSGASQSVTAIVHKHVPNRISHDFVRGQKQVTSFLSREAPYPAEYSSYMKNVLVSKVFLDEAEYERKRQEEDETMALYTELVTK